jgi:uncharacterized protein
MRLLVKILRIGVIAYLAVFAALFLGQQKLLYNIDPMRVAPAVAGLDGVREVELKTPDGETIIGWHVPAPAGQPTLLYFHGQGGSLQARASRIRRFAAAGLGVYMITWRGYGGSTGAPSEAHNVADGMLAYEALRKTGVAVNDVVLYGESLGTGIAVQLAARVLAAGVILDAPFTSTVDVAAERYPYFPVRLAMRDTYQSNRFIKDVRMPVLILHGEQDKIIPVHYGRELFAMANEPKKLALFPNGRHSDLYFHGALDQVRAFIAQTRK